MDKKTVEVRSRKSGKTTLSSKTTPSSSKTHPETDNDKNGPGSKHSPNRKIVSANSKNSGKKTEEMTTTQSGKAATSSKKKIPRDAEHGKTGSNLPTIQKEVPSVSSGKSERSTEKKAVTQTSKTGVSSRRVKKKSRFGKPEATSRKSGKSTLEKSTTKASNTGMTSSPKSKKSPREVAHDEKEVIDKSMKNKNVAASSQKSGGTNGKEKIITKSSDTARSSSHSKNTRSEGNTVKQVNGKPTDAPRHQETSTSTNRALATKTSKSSHSSKTPQKSEPSSNSSMSWLRRRKKEKPKKIREINYRIELSDAAYFESRLRLEAVLRSYYPWNPFFKRCVLMACIIGFAGGFIRSSLFFLYETATMSTYTNCAGKHLQIGARNLSLLPLEKMNEQLKLTLKGRVSGIEMKASVMFFFADILGFLYFFSGKWRLFTPFQTLSFSMFLSSISVLVMCSSHHVWMRGGALQLALAGQIAANFIFVHIVETCPKNIRSFAVFLCTLSRQIGQLYVVFFMVFAGDNAFIVFLLSGIISLASSIIAACIGGDTIQYYMNRGNVKKVKKILEKMGESEGEKNIDVDHLIDDVLYHGGVPDPDVPSDMFMSFFTRARRNGNLLLHLFFYVLVGAITQSDYRFNYFLLPSYTNAKSPIYEDTLFLISSCIGIVFFMGVHLRFGRRRTFELALISMILVHVLLVHFPTVFDNCLRRRIASGNFLYLVYIMAPWWAGAHTYLFMISKMSFLEHLPHNGRLVGLSAAEIVILSLSKSYEWLADTKNPVKHQEKGFFIQTAIYLICLIWFLFIKENHTAAVNLNDIENRFGPKMKEHELAELRILGKFTESGTSTIESS